MTARVLVVDDILANVKLLEARLSAEYFDVLTACNGQDAIDICERERVDVVLLDVMMPGMDGWKVAERLFEDERTAAIPIVFLTARAELRDRARGIELGGVEYITKPFNPVELAQLVTGLLDRVARGERAELRREKLDELRALVDD